MAKTKKVQKDDALIRTETGGVDIGGLRVEGVARFTHSCSTGDRRADSRTAHAVCSATCQSNGYVFT